MVARRSPSVSRTSSRSGDSAKSARTYAADAGIAPRPMSRAYWAAAQGLTTVVQCVPDAFHARGSRYVSTNLAPGHFRAADATRDTFQEKRESCVALCRLSALSEPH